jgi:CBS domain-containing protein
MTRYGYAMLTVTPRPRSGIFGESTNDEAYSVLPGEDRLVRDIMTQDLATTMASFTVKEAIDIIKNRNVPILVVYLGSEPVSALTEYDLAIHAVTEENADSVTLYELIKKRMVIRCREDAILADAMYAMLNHCTRHIPVVDATGDLVGALSLVDAVGAITPDAAALWQTKIRQLWRHPRVNEGGVGPS